MANIKLKFIQRFIANGTCYYYFRRPGSERIRLPGLPGSAEFMESYQQALAASPSNIGADRNPRGSVAALVGLFAQTYAFTSLAPETKAGRWRIVSKFREEHGSKMVRGLGKEHLVAILASKPIFSKRNWLVALRALLDFAVEIGWLKDNPAANIKLKMPKKGLGFLAWGEEKIETFRRRYPLGSRERLALELLLGTAQRRSDVIRMGPQHIRDGLLHARQQKTKVELRIPILPDLQAALDALPAPQHLTFLTTDAGRPFTSASFGNWFRACCKEAGLVGFSSHGLRKAACRRLAQAGCTAHEIMSWSGHRTLAEAQRYCESVKQIDLACEAANKMQTKTVKNAESGLSKTPKNAMKTKVRKPPFRLMTNSNLVACTTGRSAGFAPLRI
jgi:integrase